MEDDLKKIMQPKTIKSKNNNIFENGRHLNFLEKEDDLKFLKMEDNLQKNIQSKIIKCKNNNIFENGR